MEMFSIKKKQGLGVSSAVNTKELSSMESNDYNLSFFIAKSEDLTQYTKKLLIQEI